MVRERKSKSLKAELRRLERELRHWYRLDRIYSDGDGIFDWCDEDEVIKIEALKRRIQALKQQLGEA